MVSFNGIFILDHQSFLRNSIHVPQMMAEFTNSPMGGGWVHAVSFNSAGTKLAWVAHDCSISVADAEKGQAVTR